MYECSVTAREPSSQPESGYDSFLSSMQNQYLCKQLTQLSQLNKQTTIQKKSKKNIFIYLGNRAKHMTCFSLKQNQYLCISNSTPSATDKQTIQKKWWYTVIHNTARRIWLVCLWSKTNVFVNPLTQLSQCSSRLLFFPKVLADSLLNFFTTVIINGVERTSNFRIAITIVDAVKICCQSMSRHGVKRKLLRSREGVQHYGQEPL